MLYRNILFFLIFINLFTLHHIYSLNLDYVIVPKSIDYKDITWHGMLGKNKTKTFTAYAYRMEFTSLFLLDDREVDVVIAKRNKKAVHKQGEYCCEYWTKDGHAVIISSCNNSIAKEEIDKLIAREAEKRYYLYRDTYKKIKSKKIVGLKNCEISAEKNVFYKVILMIFNKIFLKPFSV